MPSTNCNRITVVLRPREGETLEGLQLYARLGAPVSVGRALGVIASLSRGDAVEHALESEAQLVLAEAALKRATTPGGDDHHPALRRVIEHVPTLYLQVADEIKQQALDDGDDEAMADEAAGQAIRVLVTFKQRLDKLLEPDLLTTQITGSLITENAIVAETPYAQVRVTNIDEWLKTLKNAQRYEWLRDKGRIDDMDTDLCVAREEQCYFGTELDAEVDNGLRLNRLLEINGEPV
ncbi:hypothetical protein QN382_19050 [Pseudomonas sp. 10B1]|uniref:hypothetical protein n=1 Tax=unclassified Pseudomonas TaxID=196821 RepID=UPI002B22D73C|nr:MULTISPECIES: hypothetical protein [unclassified Pseudomonas]MEA9994290.1 hypothetical protein [Pseudomonas sp. AA4]MEB0088533.1 hypothetical protein [Pseudomonas sp. RTI1]MEB0126544.1 hypothetical protein [Pseudomonas sp. CCC1.2]MEB0154643.1 hypothetical protein [Pseudomonas sp. CCC4.3]MEB0221140.1 hypothetical protein [Pseudomonas sp. AB12(2023)]